MSKSQANKLGERLRKTDPPTEEDLRALQEFVAPYYSAAQQTAEILREKLGLQSTWRVKTRNTLVEKLRRDKPRLTAVHDIAGVRIVRDMDLEEQDALVERVAKEFPKAEIIDRRSKPSHGYRAVHLVVEVAGLPVEIQIRTQFQDAWAQIMEKFADHWGRGIRYGHGPDDPDRQLEHGGTRKEIVDLVLRWANLVADHEGILAAYKRRSGQSPQSQAKADEMAARLIENGSGIQSALSELLELIPR